MSLISKFLSWVSVLASLQDGLWTVYVSKINAFLPELLLVTVYHSTSRQTRAWENIWLSLFESIYYLWSNYLPSKGGSIWCSYGQMYLQSRGREGSKFENTDIIVAGKRSQTTFPASLAGSIQDRMNRLLTFSQFKDSVLGNSSLFEGFWANFNL